MDRIFQVRHTDAMFVGEDSRTLRDRGRFEIPGDLAAEDKSAESGEMIEGRFGRAWASLSLLK